MKQSTRGQWWRFGLGAPRTPTRPPWPALITDAGLWLLLVLPVGYVVITSPGEAAFWRTLAVAAVTGTAVFSSRRAPLLALALTLAAALWVPEFIYPMAVLSFLAGVRAPRDRPTLAGFIALGVIASLVVPPLTGESGEWFIWSCILLLTFVCPWLAGRFWRQYQRLNRAGWELAGQLEREQRIIAEQERLRERARIAEDMHDSLGHDLSLIAMRAGAMEVAPGFDEESYRAAAGELRGNATKATERLQQIIGILHDDSPAERDAPIHKNIADLVEHARAAGMDVELHQSGSVTELPAMMTDRAAYRVVQESLTNAAKHARGAAAVVEVRHLDGETAVTVTNAAPTGPARPATPVSGRRGLVGIRERVRLAGGTLRTGERDGGFQVTARLPHAGGHVLAEGADTDGTRSQHQRARRRLHRDSVAAIAIPAGLVLGLAAAQMGYVYFASANSVLRPAEFDRLRTGQERAEAAESLPLMEMIDPPSEGEAAAAPEGADCRYYRSDDDFPAGDDMVAYRLCFLDGRLAAKETVPLGVESQSQGGGQGQSGVAGETGGAG